MPNVKIEPNSIIGPGPKILEFVKNVPKLKLLRNWNQIHS